MTMSKPHKGDNIHERKRPRILQYSDSNLLQNWRINKRYRKNNGYLKNQGKKNTNYRYYSPITAYPGTPEYLYVENSCQYLFEKSFRNF